MAAKATTSSGIEFLDFLQPIIATFCLAMTSKSVGAEYLRQIVKLHALQILWSDSVHGGDTTHPADHSSVIILQATQFRWGWPRFCLHGAWRSCRTNCKLFTWRWEMSGRWGRSGADWICPMHPHILWWKWVQNRHLRTNSPWGKGRMAPAEAFSAHGDLCHWSAIYWIGMSPTPFTPEAERHQRARDTTVFLWTQLEQPPQRSTSSPRPDIRTLVLPMVTFPSILVFQRISFFCSFSNDSMMTRSLVYRFSYGHLWERASRTVNSGGLRQEPWWTPTFTLNASLRLHPTDTLLLAFSYMLCVSCRSQSWTPSF